MSRFRRRSGSVRWELEDYEASLLRRLHDGLRRTLESGDPEDAVVARLFPATVVGDQDADRELRGLLHDDLLAGRLRGLEALVALLDRGTEKGERLRVDLADDELPLLLGVLNDLRLAIGARTGIEDLDRDDVEPGTPLETSLAVLDHLAWMQEQVLAILDPSASDAAEVEG